LVGFALVVRVDAAELGVEGGAVGGALAAGEGGFGGRVGFGTVALVLLELQELAEEGLGAGQEAAVVVPEAGQRGGLVFEEVEGG